MKKVIAICAILGGAMVGAVGGESVRPVAVAVTWDEVKESFGGFPVLNQQDPVVLALLAEAGGAGIIELNGDKSSLEFVKDGAGNDLDGSLGMFPKVSDDGKMLLVNLRGSKPPAPGSGTLRARGSLVLITGSETEEKTTPVVAAKKGEVLAVTEKLSFKISKAGKPDWGDAPFMVELETSRDIPEVAEVAFHDGAGKLIESSAGGSSRMAFGSKVTVQRSFNLKRKPENLQVKVKLWTDLAEKTVPFDLKVGLDGKK